ncbi:hypothetical protein KEM48_011952 [Puccinia striiformis f. sp. tritici PST-130]|nr:hypothetical protein KEM48_011952 [Puccinia striiformis f. sp. tritici PST-130]
MRLFYLQGLVVLMCISYTSASMMSSSLGSRGESFEAVSSSTEHAASYSGTPDGSGSGLELSEEPTGHSGYGDGDEQEVTSRPQQENLGTCWLSGCGTDAWCPSCRQCWNHCPGEHSESGSTG